MSILWIGLSLFVVVSISYLIIMAVTKRAFLMLKGQKEGPVQSNWIPLQIYSGADSLGHPDLKKIFEMSELEDDKLDIGESK